MMNVVRNYPSPITNPTLMFPKTLIAMKSCAKAPNNS